MSLTVVPISAKISTAEVLKDAEDSDEVLVIYLKDGELYFSSSVQAPEEMNWWLDLIKASMISNYI